MLPARPRRSRLVMGAALGLVAALTVAGCASPSISRQPIARPGVASDVTQETTTTRPAAGPVELAGGRPVAAIAKKQVQLHSRPARSAASGKFPARTPWGNPTVFLVRKAQRDAAGEVWLQVLLPRRPNGGTAWVQARWFLITPMRHEVEVDLSDRRLVVKRGSKVVRSFRVAIGDSSTPTPVGDFFVTVKLQPPMVSKVYGEWALGLSAYSEVLDQFGTGDGQIALHGTAGTWALGKAVSNGCVRMANEDVTALEKLTPVGTPVSIRA